MNINIIYNIQNIISAEVLIQISIAIIFNFLNFNSFHQQHSYIQKYYKAFFFHSTSNASENAMEISMKPSTLFFKHLHKKKWFEKFFGLNLISCWGGKLYTWLMLGNTMQSSRSSYDRLLFNMYMFKFILAY